MAGGCGDAAAGTGMSAPRRGRPACSGATKRLGRAPGGRPAPASARARVQIPSLPRGPRPYGLRSSAGSIPAHDTDASLAGAQTSESPLAGTATVPFSAGRPTCLSESS